MEKDQREVLFGRGAGPAELLGASAAEVAERAGVSTPAPMEDPVAALERRVAALEAEIARLKGD